MNNGLLYPTREQTIGADSSEPRRSRIRCESPLLTMSCMHIREEEWAFVYTADNKDSDREAIRAYLIGREIGCLKRRSKKVGIRSVWSRLPGSLPVSNTQVGTGSDGSYLAKTADCSDLDQQRLTKSIKQHVTGRQLDMWRPREICGLPNSN